MNRDVEYWYNRRTNRWHLWERDQNRIIHNHDLPLFCDHAPTEYERLFARPLTAQEIEVIRRFVNRTRTTQEES